MNGRPASDAKGAFDRTPLISPHNGWPPRSFTRRNALLLGAAVLLFLTGLAVDRFRAGEIAQGDSSAPCTVSRVGDGDSFECEDGRRVRLLLIDAPELAQGRAGEESHRALLDLMPPGSAIQLELDVETEDSFGRTLAYVTLPDGRIVNEELLRRGFAVMLVYPPNVRYVDRFRSVANDAQAAGAGLWGEGGFRCLPVDFRARTCGR